MSRFENPSIYLFFLLFPPFLSFFFFFLSYSYSSSSLFLLAFDHLLLWRYCQRYWGPIPELFEDYCPSFVCCCLISKGFFFLSFFSFMLFPLLSFLYFISHFSLSSHKSRRTLMMNLTKTSLNLSVSPSSTPTPVYISPFFLSPLPLIIPFPPP